MEEEDKKIYCPRIEAFCPHQVDSKTTNTCFIMMAYEEIYSPKIEKILNKATKDVLKLKPVLAKDLKKGGSTDVFCTRICKPIIESFTCILDCTYNNTNIGIEYATAQRLGKPVIVTRYIPNKTNKISKKEKNTLDELKKKGVIQYSVMPIKVPSDISGIYYISYSTETELFKELKGKFAIKKAR